MNKQRKNTFVRLLPEDASIVIDLIKAVYGNTYSYKDYYSVDYVQKLLAEEKIISFGTFNDLGELAGHTALIAKDTSCEYYESGMSMRHPRRKPVDKLIEAELFEYIFEFASKKAFFIHQNTTTYHAFAQRYARKFMNTKFCGLIHSYAYGEKIQNIQHSQNSMSAIMYTSILSEDPNQQKDIFLPNGIWGEWLKQIIMNLGVSRNLVFCEAKGYNPSETMYLTLIEENKYLDLYRFAICDSDFKQFDFDPKLESRTLLIHMPAKEHLIEKYFLLLLQNNFLPIGIRPHNRRMDEIIFQRISTADLRDKLDDCKIFWENEKKLLDDWCYSCQKTI